jgi:hypothetical protein
MDFLEKLKTSADVVGETNTLGGGGGPLESGAYDMTIETAYFDTSSGGATSLNFVFKSNNGQTLRQTIYVTSGTAKGGSNKYVDKRTGEKKYLPGFNTANSICLLATGEEISAQEIETKTLKIMDWNERKEVPQQKSVVMTLLGKDITLGVKKVIENKREQDSSGAWVSAPSGETRTLNEIDKVFRASDHMTTPEILNEDTSAEFYATWVAKNTGVNHDKSLAKAGEFVATASASSATSAAPKKSLFA